VEQISEGDEMRTRDKKRIARDFYRGMSVVELAKKYVHLFSKTPGGWGGVCLAIEKILREAYK
jgi:hypothetical protein